MLLEVQSVMATLPGICSGSVWSRSTLLGLGREVHVAKGKCKDLTMCSDITSSKPRRRDESTK